MRSRLTLMLVLLLVGLPDLSRGAPKSTIVRSAHNLSVSGQGTIKSTRESRICIFCHSSHNASPEGPLWNHETTSPEQFKTYQRSTLKGLPQQPNGATKLCLSCHDGTIAVGGVHSIPGGIQMQGVGAGGEIPASRKSHLGTDLTGTHPVSIRFQQELALTKNSLRWPPADPDNVVGTDADGYVQCTSCHDPHGSRSETLPFWNKETFSQVCQVCHAY
jgi:predicted CXXCH cytochrome family protein